MDKRTVLYKYNKSEKDELSIDIGEIVLLIREDEKTNGDWVYVRKMSDGTCGLVPSNFLSQKNTQSNLSQIRSPTSLPSLSRSLKTATPNKIKLNSNMPCLNNNTTNVSPSECLYMNSDFMNNNGVHSETNLTNGACSNMPKINNDIDTCQQNGIYKPNYKTSDKKTCPR